VASAFTAGLRVTTPEAMEVVRMVLSGKVNKDIVGLINRHGPFAVGMSGEDASTLTATRKAAIVDGEPVDIGLVGEIVATNPGALEALLADGRIPVVSSVAAGRDGEVYNVNADTAAAALAVALDAAKLVVLTDPDLLSNHGLRRGDDASLAIALIERLRQRGPVRFDESFHGGAHDEGPWRALLRFPLALAVLQALLAGGLLLWGGVRRFGAPLPADPPLAAGKAALIESMAELLRFGGHSAHALDRYLRSSLQEVAAGLHASGELRGGALDAWLDRVAARVHVPGVETLRREAGRESKSPAALVETARRIHLWRTRMLHGSE